MDDNDELYQDEKEHPAPQSLRANDPVTILDTHTYKTEAELAVWWWKGVKEQASKPLPDWKKDNPAHPKYQHKDQYDPMIEEV